MADPLSDIMTTINKMRISMGARGGTGIGGGAEPPRFTPPGQYPGRVGQAPPQMTGLFAPQKSEPLLPKENIKYDVSRAGGMMPAPSGASPTDSVYSTIVNPLTSFLGAWQEKRNKKERAEAANIAGNLMNAINTKDSATAFDIMNDPKAMKMLKKVFPGWLTPVGEGKEEKKKKPPTAPEQGFMDALNAQTQKFQQQVQQYQLGKGEAAPPMPRQIAGYALPAAAPEDFIKAQSDASTIEHLHNHPDASLAVGPREQVQIQEQLAKMGFTADLEKTLASGYMRALTMSQNAIDTYQRMMDVARQRGQDAKDIEAMREKASAWRTELQTSTRKSIAGMILGARKGDKASDLTYKALDALLKSQTTQRDNLQVSYTQQVKAGNDDAALATAAQIKAVDSYLDDIRGQMQNLATDDKYDKTLEYLLGGDVELPDGE